MVHCTPQASATGVQPPVQPPVRPNAVAVERPSVLARIGASGIGGTEADSGQLQAPGNRIAEGLLPGRVMERIPAGEGGGTLGGNVVSPSAPITGYHLTFDDEFNTLSVSADPYVNHTLWCTCSWWYPAQPIVNMHINTGFLQLQNTKTGTNWNGAHLSTWSPSNKSFSQRFGYWEIRFKPSGQDGILDDFYLISEEDILTDGAFPSNEMDIFEKPKGNILYLTLHNGTASSGWRWNEVGVPNDFDSQYHTLGLLWEKESGYIKWYLDGKLVWTAAKYNDTDLSPMIMTLETGVGGAFGFPDATTANPSTFNVDYVRVWSNDPTVPFWTATQ